MHQNENSSIKDLVLYVLFRVFGVVLFTFTYTPVILSRLFYTFLYLLYPGLVSLEMPLSADPVLGVWTIKVLYGSNTVVIQTFEVDEYGKDSLFIVLDNVFEFLQ